MHSIFGTKHLIIIAVCAVLIAVLFILSKRMNFATVCKAMFYVGIVSEIIKIFYYIVQNEATHGGILPKTDLPFHLCSIQIIFIAIFNFSSSEKLKRFLLSFMYPSCLFGGIAAILIATNSSLNGLWIISLQYFCYHVALVVFSLRVITGKEFKVQLSDYTNCLKFLVIIMFFAFYVNSIIYDGVSDINFMYVASPPQKGLPFLTEEYGWLVYIVHYACLVLFCVSICYAKPIFKAIKCKLSKSKKAESAETEKEKEFASV